MIVTTPNQRALLAEIRKLFGNDPFNADLVANKTYRHQELVAALEPALARGKRWWKKPGKTFHQSERDALHVLLTYLAEQDQYGYWHFRGETHD
jgi:hypothetical protein